MDEKKQIKEIPVNFKAVDDKYTNQTLIQMTEHDVGIGFGLISFDENGNDTVNLHTMMRMSHKQAKKLHAHLGHMFKEMENKIDE